MRPIIVCAGEVLWDRILDGEGGAVEHIGGAPFNAAAHAAKRGMDARLVSAVGADARGRGALEAMAAFGVDSRLVKILPGHPTGLALVSPASEGGEAGRFSLPPAAYDHVRIAPDELEALEREGPAALVFGTLARFRSETAAKTLDSLLSRLSGARALWDVNLRAPFYDKKAVEKSLLRCDILKMNESEARELSGMLFGREMEPEAFAKSVFSGFGISDLIVTLGAAGAAGMERGGDWIKIPGLPARVVDTVGAGDAFSAGFLSERLSGAGFAKALEAGNKAGAAAVSHAGALGGL